jgi:hypothetical protein
MNTRIPLPRTRSGVAGVTRLAPPHPHQVPVAMVQGTLALELDHHPGLPPAPELRVVSGGAGDLDGWAARFAQAVVEVIGGDRTPHQLIRCTSPSVHADLLRRTAALNRAGSPEQRARRLRAQVRSVHVFQPSALSAEVSVHIRHGQRSRALAARIEHCDGRWMCTALEFG